MKKELNLAIMTTDIVKIEEEIQLDNFPLPEETHDAAANRSPFQKKNIYNLWDSTITRGIP